MNIHEYQGKEILRKYGVTTPRGFPCFSVDEAVRSRKKTGWQCLGRQGTDSRRWPWAMGGGVKVAKSLVKSENMHPKFSE